MVKVNDKDPKRFPLKQLELARSRSFKGYPSQKLGQIKQNPHAFKLLTRTVK